MQIAESMRPLSNEVCIELTTSAGASHGTRRLRPNCEEKVVQFVRPAGRQYGRPEFRQADHEILSQLEKL